MSGSTVLPFLRVVAAGHRPNNRLHLVLVLTPAKSAQPGSFELRDWPSRILEAAARGITIRINSAPAVGPITKVATWKQLDIKPDGHALTPAELQDVDKAWQSALFLNAGSWADLAADIDNSLRARKREAYPSPKAPSAADRSGATLGPEGELLVPPPRPDDIHALEGVVPLAQTALATEAETVRAARLLAIMMKGRIEGASPVPLQSGTFATEQDAADARQTAFRTAYEAMQDARNRSKKHFDTVKSALDGTVQQYTPPAATDLVPRPDLVCNGRPDCPNEASHAYGTTLQRTQADPAAAGADVPISPCAVAVRARFYAMGGDSILSRLFSLCIDLTVDRTAVPQGYLHLAAELPAFPSVDDLPLVFTAARRDGDQFWPCSMFDPNARVARGAALIASGGNLPVPQAKGVWCMAGGDASSTRFELASLDVRSATERARARPAQGSGGDRGEQHRTAGFVLLDRQRADEAARDLAIGDTQAGSVKGGGVVVLHAEELTVGRRVDAAAAAPGAIVGDAQAIRWRTLMGRMVHLGFPAHPGAESALRKLVPTGKDGLRYQDATFQAGARLLPKLAPRAGDAVPVEAVVEEAIFTWDGTPAGALTDPGTPNSAATTKLDRAPPRPIPWNRTQRPPLAQDGQDLRPAPLRYGAPYLFGLTSIFLGGIGPSVHEASLVRSNARTSMLPIAAEAGRHGTMSVRPRRFLRHEGIGAPLLLFPRNVALRQNGSGGVLGFEPLDTAIVRTVRPPADPPPRQAPPEPPAGDRDGPHETTRVFLPPELALDAVARHGMLDVPDSAAIVRGGLQQVTFRPRRPGLAAGKPVAQGFPTVETFTRPGLGGEQATLRREITPGISNEIGLPLFEPGPNTVGQREPGFLPDPAAEFYCLRARIPGTSRYLDGAILVPVYQPGHAYPDALPLVIQLRRNPEIRKQPAASVDELQPGPHQRRRMMQGGAIAPAGTSNGAPIWFLALTLCPDEEFDLEVTCLPSDNTLACWFAPVETMAAQLRLAETVPEARRRLQELAGSLPSLSEKGGPVFTAICDQQVDRDAINDVARLLGETMRARRPIEEIAAVGKLRIVHAVNRPEAKPGLRDLATRRPSPPTKDWRITDIPGSTTMLLQGVLAVDFEQVGAVELVATTVPTGNDIDDSTRSRSRSMRRSGRWPWTVDAHGTPVKQDIRSVLGFDVNGEGKVTLPPESVQLLRIDNLPIRAPFPIAPPFLTEQGRYTTLDLGELHKRAIAGPPALEPGSNPADTTRVRSVQHQVLTGTRARRLRLRLVLIGRHVDTFETAPRFLADAMPLYRRRMPLRSHEQSQTWPNPANPSFEEWSVWVKATERPPPPDALQPEVSFHWERWSEPCTGDDKGNRYGLKRSTRVRLWFRRGWFASGEGERLGIVLWPPDQAGVPANKDENIVRFHGRDISVATLDDTDLGPGGAFVSRWGGDPIRGEASPQLGVLIPPKAFVVEPDRTRPRPHDPRWVHRALMPQAADGDRNPADPGQDSPTLPAASALGDPTNKPMMEVTLLTLEPYFDLDREQWFVDVPLLPIRATEPFVRFGLVRYQHQAIDATLCVSRPVMKTADLLPERTVWADVWTADQSIKFDVTVQGGGSTDAALPDWHAAVPLVEMDPETWGTRAAAGAAGAARPVMRVTLLHERDEAPGRLHRQPVWKDRVAITLACDPLNALLQWTSGTLSVSADDRRHLKAGRYVALVEEVDRRMPANYAEEPIAIPKMFEPDAYVDSGPRFLARIVLFEDVAPLTDPPAQRQS